MLGIFRKFDLNRFIIIFRFGTDISIYIIIKARLTMRNSNQKENVPIAPEDTNLKTFFTSIRIIGILIAFLLIAGIVLIELEEEGEEAVLSTPPTSPAPEMPLELKKPTRLVKIQVPVDFEFDPYYYSWKDVRRADWYEYAFEGFSGEVVIKRTLSTRLGDTYDEVFKVRACNENACSDWAYFK